MTVTADVLTRFEEQGFYIFRGFYDPETELMPIWRGIYDIIGILLADHMPDIVREPFSPDTFDSGYNAMILRDRSLGAVTYDAVKQIPAFIRLSAGEKNEALAKALRKTERVGVARAGDGIRINNPNEPQFRAPWHQEFTFQFRSRDGLVFWAPLVPVTEALGPVVICPGSHKGGVRQMYYEDPSKAGTAYGLALWEAERAVAPYEKVAPLLNPGDLLVMDFLTLHRSGVNAGERSLWSMQLRYFNYHDSIGRAIRWAGGFMQGNTILDVMPDLLHQPSEEV